MNDFRNTQWICIQLVFTFLQSWLVSCEEIVCYTYNFEEYLQCLWNTTSLESSTDVTIKWSLVSGPWVSDWLDCPIRSQNSCRWDMEQGDVDPYCVIRVNVSLFDSYHVVKCQDKVKPAPVENVVVSKVNASCLVLQWSLKKEYFSILYPQLYRVTCLPLHGYGHDSESPQESLLWMVNNTRLDACGLVPYTKYLIQIAAKPSEGGLWSEARSLNITTHKAVPGSAPMIKSDFFSRSLQKNGAYSNVLIIWQEIQNQRIYGSHLLYLASICPHNSSQESRDCAEETEFNFAQFQVPAQQEVTARIWSKNEIGLSREFAVIRVPPEDELLKIPDVVVVVNSTHGVLFLDVTDDQKDVQFSVYWCKKDFKNLHWMDNVIKTSIEIAHSGNIYLKYGVAVNHNGRTSGIVWADCVIQNHELSSSLDVTLTSTEQNYLMVKWSIPVCNMHLLSAVVDHYILYICSSPDCTARKTLNLKPDVTSYVEKITNDRGNCALVKIITISGEESQAGHVQCLAVEHGSKLYLIAIIAVIVAILIFIPYIVLKLKRCCSADIEIQVPRIENNQDKKLLDTTPSTSDRDFKEYVRHSKALPDENCVVELMKIPDMNDSTRGKEYTSVTSSLTDVKDRTWIPYTSVTSSVSSILDVSEVQGNRTTSVQSSVELCDSYILMEGIDQDLLEDVS
ncbi:uncharacterized protein LOC111118673 isoform X1 [Crassostrea virginica]